jgi:hypothetical protein
LSFAAKKPSHNGYAVGKENFCFIFCTEGTPKVTYSAPLTAKFSDKSLTEIEKAAKKLGVTRSTLVREVMTRYLPDYLASAGDRRPSRPSRPISQKKLG